MTQYEVVLIIFTVVNFVIMIINFVKSNNKETNEDKEQSTKEIQKLRESNVELIVSIKALNQTFKDYTQQNKKDHDHFFKVTNDHETRITVLETHHQSE